MKVQQKELLDQRYAETNDGIKAILAKLSAWVEIESQNTDINWTNLGSNDHVFNLLQQISEYVFDGDSEK